MVNIGNAWHIPNNPQPPGQASMRVPLEAIEAGTAVLVSSGNQFRGPGNPGNQTESDSALMLRKMGDATWKPLPLHFQSASGNDKHFFATIPGHLLEAGDV